MGKRGPKPKDECPRGHLFTDENTYMEPVGNRFRRRCLECKRNRAKRHYHLHRDTKKAYKRWYCYGDPEGRSWEEVKVTL